MPTATRRKFEPLLFYVSPNSVFYEVVAFAVVLELFDEINIPTRKFNVYFHVCSLLSVFKQMEQAKRFQLGTRDNARLLKLLFFGCLSFSEAAPAILSSPTPFSQTLAAYSALIRRVISLFQVLTS